MVSQLGLGLQHNAGGDLPAPDGGDELFKIRDLPDIGELIDQAPHMHWKPSAVHVIRFLAEQIEHLAVGHADQKVEAGVRVRHDQEQCGPFVPDGVQVEFVIGRDVPQLLNIEDRQARTAAHEYALGCLAGCWTITPSITSTLLAVSWWAVRQVTVD